MLVASDFRGARRNNRHMKPKRDRHGFFCWPCQNEVGIAVVLCVGLYICDLKHITIIMLWLLVSLGNFGASLSAQGEAPQSLDTPGTALAEESASDGLGLGGIAGENGLQLSSAVEVALVMTVLSLSRFPTRRRIRTRSRCARRP